MKKLRLVTKYTFLQLTNFRSRKLASHDSRESTVDAIRSETSFEFVGERSSNRVVNDTTSK